MEAGFYEIAKDFGVPAVLWLTVGYGITQIRKTLADIEANKAELKDTRTNYNTLLAAVNKVMDHLQEKVRHETHPKDPTRILHRSEVYEAVLETHKIIEAHCGVSHCPVIPIVERHLQEKNLQFSKLEQLWSSHAEEARKDRQETLSALHSIFDRMSSSVTDTMSRLVSAFETIVLYLKNGKEKKHEKD